MAAIARLSRTRTGMTGAGPSSKSSSFCVTSNAICNSLGRTGDSALLKLLYNFCAMRKCVHFVTVVLAVVMLAALACAEPVSSLTRTDCVDDFAGVLSPATITQLKEMCRQVLDKAQATVVVVTVKSTDGED